MEKVGISGEKLEKVKSLSIVFLAISDQYATFIFGIFFKMAAGRHFGSPFWAILDDRKSLSIVFLAISDQYATFFWNIFFKMVASGHFGSPICVTIGLSMAMPNMKLIGEFVTQLEMPQAF